MSDDGPERLLVTSRQAPESAAQLWAALQKAFSRPSGTRGSYEKKGKAMQIPDEAVIEANRAVEAAGAEVPVAVLRAAVEAAAPHIAAAERERIRGAVKREHSVLLYMIDNPAVK